MFINVFRTKHMRLLCIFILFIYIININSYTLEDEDEDFVDVGVRLVGGKRDSLIADLIAEERNVLNAGHVEGINLYHFNIRRKRNARSKRAIDDTIEELKRDERIEFVKIGERLVRSKREYLSNERMINLIKKNKLASEEAKNTLETDEAKNTLETDEAKNKHASDELKHKLTSEEVKQKATDNLKSKIKMSFNDNLYNKQWYLDNKGQLNTPKDHDINVVPAWLSGYTGKGITICIVDDGLDHRHPDLVDLYRPEVSSDLNDLKDPNHDPLPGTYDGQNSHGTRCGGAAAAKANNEVCGVGAAFGASISAIRMLDGPLTSLLEARALTMFANDVDIKSASWGPTDDGTVMEAPDDLINAALDYGVTYGRNGKGTLFVWAAGNGGDLSDDCGADGYVSHHNVISIGSLNHLGQTPYFDEACPSTMAVAYTGGAHGHSPSEKSMPIGVVTPDVSGKCTTGFFGTSAAAPVVAGALALVLEANPDLTYRDVMHIIARTARIPGLLETDGWIINGAGYHVNDKFGFGAVDVARMIALAQKWKNVDERHDCYLEYPNVNRQLDFGSVVEVSINVKSCKNVESIEHVVANISYSYPRRGDVKITIISPSQTPSEMLSFRKNDATNQAVKYFPFLSNHHWGESPIGNWVLRIETRKPQNSQSKDSVSDAIDLNELSHFGLRIYGSSDPDKKNDYELKKRGQNKAYIPSKEDIEATYNDEMQKRASPNVMQKRDYEIRKKSVDQQDLSFLGLLRRVFIYK